MYFKIISGNFHEHQIILSLLMQKCMMARPTSEDTVVTVNPMVGNEIINGINDVLLSIMFAAMFKNADLNIT